MVTNINSMAMKRFLSSLIAVITLFGVADACTSAIVSDKMARRGSTLMWKHRDTGNENNFVARVSGGRYDYVALFNAGDSLLSEAWAGLNSAGFGIMNTASYNLAPDTACIKDREGVVMIQALKECATLSDFEQMLNRLPRPLGVQANFGVVDASGNGAYYETSDSGYIKYPLSDAADGVLYRTNYSYSGDTLTMGYGYIRECNAKHLLEPYRKAHNIGADTFTEVLSRSFYHSLMGRDMLAGAGDWLVDQDFIPRNSSSASVVIETGANPVMWVAIGYPPCAVVMPVTVDSVPDVLQPSPETWRSKACDEVVARKNNVFPIKRGSGSHYIDVKALRHYNDSCKVESYRQYDAFYKRH